MDLSIPAGVYGVYGVYEVHGALHGVCDNVCECWCVCARSVCVGCVRMCVNV